VIITFKATDRNVKYRTRWPSHQSSPQHRLDVDPHRISSVWEWKRARLSFSDSGFPLRLIFNASARIAKVVPRRLPDWNLCGVLPWADDSWAEAPRWSCSALSPAYAGQRVPGTTPRWCTSARERAKKTLPGLRLRVNKTWPAW